MFILVTWGGDPEGAYKIARFLQENYERFTCYVTGVCKSAGTLIALGAHDLIMSSVAELGPLDTQISKRDEAFESQSGLVVSTSLKALREEAFDAFEQCLSRFKSGWGKNATLKTASEVAAKLSTGLFGHIYSQLDPINIGETKRSILVATEYGSRLQEKSGNYSKESLDKLIEGYPSHDFVIDRTEARNLFNLVREPNGPEYLLMMLLGSKSFTPAVDGSASETPRFLSKEFSMRKAAKISDNIGGDHNEQQPAPEFAEVGGENGAIVPEQPGSATTGGTQPVQ
jgi:Serine dehydrogenase proteinase